jgi:hypothetical protein
MAVGESAPRRWGDRGRGAVVLWMALLLMAGTCSYGATPAGTVVVSVASASWDGGTAVSEPVSFTVGQYGDVILDPPAAAGSGVPGTSEHYAVRITNYGNGSDRFVLQLSGEQGWPAAVYRDDNADGLLQPAETTRTLVTPVLAPQEQFAGVVVVSVPAGASGSERTQLLVSSEVDPRVSVSGSYASTALPVPEPVAQFSATPTSGTVPLRVDFRDLSSGEPTAWQWDFGDGGRSTRQSPSHRYAHAGRYTVSLTITTPAGQATTTKPDFIVADFRDVAYSYWAYQYIMTATGDGLSAGYPDGTYHPDQVVTRDQMATFMARATAGGDANVQVPTGVAEPAFSDVPESYWAYRYIEYVAARGIATGFPGGGFGPSRPVDRAQMATFVSRGMAVRTGGSSLETYEPPAMPTFRDVPPDHWAYPFVEYSAAQGIVQGYPDGTYQPDTACARDQMAVFLTRAFGAEP